MEKRLVYNGDIKIWEKNITTLKTIKEFIKR